MDTEKSSTEEVKFFESTAEEAKVVEHSENSNVKAKLLLQICERLLVHAKIQRYMLTRPRSKKSSRIITMDSIFELKYLVARLSNTECISQELIDQALKLIKKIASNTTTRARRRNSLTEGSGSSSITFLKKNPPSSSEVFNGIQSIIQKINNWQLLYEEKFRNGGPEQGEFTQANLRKCIAMNFRLSTWCQYLRIIQAEEKRVATNTSS